MTEHRKLHLPWTLAILEHKHLALDLARWITRLLLILLWSGQNGFLNNVPLQPWQSPSSPVEIRKPLGDRLSGQTIVTTYMHSAFCDS